MKRLWQVLLAVAKRIGQVQTWIIFTLFYFVILAPVALIYQLMADPLRLRNGTQPIWRRRPTVDDPLAWVKEQA
jgi:hypothetical protein